MNRGSRDEFSEHVKQTLAQRVGYRCSNRECRAITSGPHSDPSRSINLGVAAHITAASCGGPRYDPSLTAAGRRSGANGIWLCQTCAKLIDNDLPAFSTAKLRQWKASAEGATALEVGRAIERCAGSISLGQEVCELLEAADDSGAILIFDTDQTGKWVRAGTRDFIDEADPAVAATYLEALHQLVSGGLCRYEGGVRYSLTGTGSKTARRLRDVFHQDA